MGSPLKSDELRDLAQDVRVDVWNKLDSFKGLARLETWVYRFCHLRLLHRLSLGRDREWRRGTAEARYAQDRGDEASPAPEPCASSALEQMLSHLTPNEALVTRRRHVEQLSFAEIAEEIGTSVSTAKTYYYRGLEKLRTVLRSSPPPDAPSVGQAI